MPKPFITNLHLRNYRCFENMEIDFHEKLTVLVATNGAGKTSILDALAVALGPFVGAFDEAYGKGFEANDIRQIRIRATASNEMEYAVGGCSLAAKGFIPALQIKPVIVDESGNTIEIPSSWERSLAGPTKAKTTRKDATDLVNSGKRLQDAVRTPGTNVSLPVIGYYGTGRLWRLKKLTAGKLPKTSRTIGYTDCLDPGSSYSAFAEWFRYWSHSALEAKFTALKRNELPENTEFDEFIASVNQAINTCLAPSGWKNIEYSMARQELVAHHEEYGDLPVSLLSDGIRNMIGIVADIAFRATKLNPQLGAEASSKTPGIVLIDEIDMHLHPAWQQVVLGQLQAAFPKIQFVVTTHSPQVLTSVDASCIRKLRQVQHEQGQSEIVVEHVTQQTKGVASSDLLAEIMGVDPIPDLSEAKDLSAYHALIQQNLHQGSEGLRLRAALEQHFSAEHHVIRDCERMIRLQAFKQKLPLPEFKGNREEDKPEGAQ
jgi:predicted ATP-binding protein involved in virulence